jgi:hypothetical protein
MRNIIDIDSELEKRQSQTSGIFMQLLSATHSIMQTTQSIRIVMVGNTSMNQLVNKICVSVWLTISLSSMSAVPSDTNPELILFNTMIYEENSLQSICYQK